MRSYSKKIFSLLLVIALVFSLSSCSVRSIREIISDMQIDEADNSHPNTNKTLFPHLFSNRRSQ